MVVVYMTACRPTTSVRRERRSVVNIGCGTVNEQVMFLDHMYSIHKGVNISGVRRTSLDGCFPM